jgi:hypothetical protein
MSGGLAATESTFCSSLHKNLVHSFPFVVIISFVSGDEFAISNPHNCLFQPSGPQQG